MKILIGCEVFYPYLYGGGEIFAYETSRHLVKLGHEVHIICPRRSFDRPNTELPTYSSVQGVKVHRIDGEFRYERGIQSVPYMLRMYLEASRLIREARIDIVNPQTFRPCLPLLAAAKKNGVPCIATIFDIYSAGGLFGLENWLRFYGAFGMFGWGLEQVILRLPFDLVITNSKAVKAKIRKFFLSSHIQVINCAVDLQDYAKGNPKKEDGMVLYVGRLVQYKNLNDLLLAVAKVRKLRGNATLTIAGSGPLESFLRKIMAKTNYVSFVRMPRDREKIGLLRRAEVFVLPSSEEGFGIALLEANAAYTPFVCYDIPALKEIVQSTGGGLLAEHRNVDDLAEKILKIIEQKALARRLAKAGRKVVETRFSWAYAAQRMERVYRIALNAS